MLNTVPRQEETFTAYITRHTLATGEIEVVQVEWLAAYPDLVSVVGLPSRTFFREGRDWHRNWEAAARRADVMRRAKIVSLNKQIRRFESMSFDRPKTETASAA